MKIKLTLLLVLILLMFSACGDNNNDISSTSAMPNVPISQGTSETSTSETSGTAETSESTTTTQTTITTEEAKVKYYTITFMLEDKKLEVRKVKEGDAIGKMPTAKRKGYYLGSWYDEHYMTIYPEYVPHENLTLYPEWISLNILTITKQPKDARCEKGDWVTFTVEATSEETKIRYQWQYYDSHSNRFVDFSDDDGGWSANWTTKTLAVWSDVYDALQVRCVVTNGMNTLTSDVATMTAEYPDSLIITEQPMSNTATLEGFEDTDSVQYTVAVSGGTAPYTYRWETRIMGGTDDVSDGAFWDVYDDPCFKVSGAKTKTLKLSEVRYFGDGFEFRCRITDSAGKVVYSNFAQVIVNMLGA